MALHCKLSFGVPVMLPNNSLTTLKGKKKTTIPNDSTFKKREKKTIVDRCKHHFDACYTDISDMLKFKSLENLLFYENFNQL